jgi:hypothetical protein
MAILDGAQPCESRYHRVAGSFERDPDPGE